MQPSPPRSWPPAALPRLMPKELAAYYCGLPSEKFERLVLAGQLPQSRSLDGVPLWDRLALDIAIGALFDGRGDGASIVSVSVDLNQTPAHALTVKELSARWQCSDQHVYNLVRSGKLQAIRLEKSVRIPMQVVTEFEGRSGAPSSTATDSDTDGPSGVSTPRPKTTPPPSGRALISKGRSLSRTE